MEPVLVAVYASAIEAELARATLAAAGIDCLVRGDDAGGMMPSLDMQKGFRVLVDADRADEARSLISDAAQELPEG